MAGPLLTCRVPAGCVQPVPLCCTAIVGSLIRQLDLETEEWIVTRWNRPALELGTLFWLLTACGETDAGPDESAATVQGARAEILAELQEYYADFSARDWEAFSDHFWPDATITTVWQPPGETGERVVVTSVAQFVEQAPEGPGSREIFEEEMTSADLRVTGNLAQVWARYSARFGDPGDVAEWEGTDAFTLLKHEGSWRIVSLVFASDG